MSDPLPPLAALRAFESAGRHLSFKHAAAALHVTPAAISQQIRQLEDHLGVALFTRQTRRLALTPQGQAMLPKVCEGFDALRAAVAQLRARPAPASLSITAPPSFASRWLIPRLPRFWAAHPDIALRIASSPDSIDSGPLPVDAPAAGQRPADGLDVAIRFGTGHYPGQQVTPIFSPDCLPVCSPDLLASGHPIRHARDLLQHVLLQDDTTRGAEHPMDWPAWFARQNIRDTLVHQGPRFSNALLAIDAAINGQGIALAMTPLVQADLQARRLVCPLAIAAPSPFCYSLVVRPDAMDDARVQSLRDWLVREAGSVTP